MSDLLKQVIQDLIADRAEQAQVSIHDYIVAKTQEVVGLPQTAVTEEDKSKLKAYKIKVDGWSEEKAWQFVEDQEVCTIETLELKGDTLYLYPHFDDKYSAKDHTALQKAADAFCGI